MSKPIMIKRKFQLQEQKNIDEEFEKIVKEQGWYNAEAKIHAMKANYISWIKKEQFKFRSD